MHNTAYLHLPSTNYAIVVPRVPYRVVPAFDVYDRGRQCVIKQ